MGVPTANLPTADSPTANSSNCLQHPHRRCVGQRNSEGGPFRHLTQHRNNAIVLLNDLLANGQANARSLELILSMQPLERNKHMVLIGHVEPYTIILDVNIVARAGLAIEL